MSKETYCGADVFNRGKNTSKHGPAQHIHTHPLHRAHPPPTARTTRPIAHRAHPPLAQPARSRITLTHRPPTTRTSRPHIDHRSHIARGSHNPPDRTSRPPIDHHPPPTAQPDTCHLLAAEFRPYYETKSNYMIWYDFAVIKLNHLFESMDHIGLT